MEIASFGIGSQRTDHTVKDAKDKLVISMNAALGISPSEMCLVGTEEVSDNWFNLNFEIPNKKGLLDQLRWAAIYKEPWLGLCGVKAVTIGNESQILLQPVTRSLSLTIQAGELSINFKQIVIFMFRKVERFYKLYRINAIIAMK